MVIHYLMCDVLVWVLTDKHGGVRRISTGQSRFSFHDNHAMTQSFTKTGNNCH
jgi:hypothetical protein